jgi:ZIP family zinc transporter/zinc and cadmium transporter
MTGVLFAALASLGDIGGGLLVIWRTGRDRGLLAALTGFGAGFMLALVILGMLPHAIDVRGGFLAVLLGYLVVHVTQHTLTPHFHFGEETHTDAMVSRGIGVWALVGLLPHSFFDGVAISSGFLESSSLGLLVFTGILLHKVPTGVSLGSIMLASGNTPQQALAAVLGIAAATVAGALITPFVGAMAVYGLPLAAGVTLYVAASNLIPESQHERSIVVHGGFLAGVVAYIVLQMVLPDMPH